ncbi:hypothetical protein K7X08_004267 [Anisodus acutangulus]|uniref:Uncharacterized protein n=1 Tax=Anisodus acutangulus TaxID=402998 RepID=A0A9Q1MIC6_9SOLA|nr:hypothetical protein K7X08_004267 [Anisodus acutangulus]
MNSSTRKVRRNVAFSIKKSLLMKTIAMTMMMKMIHQRRVIMEIIVVLNRIMEEKLVRVFLKIIDLFDL